MTHAGFSLPDSYIHLALNTPADPRCAAHELVHLPKPPTAIFAAADIQALSVLKAARGLV